MKSLLPCDWWDSSMALWMPRSRITCVFMPIYGASFLMLHLWSTLYQGQLHKLWGSGQNENAGPLFKNYWEFQDGDSTAFIQVQVVRPVYLHMAGRLQATCSHSRLWKHPTVPPGCAQLPMCSWRSLAGRHFENFLPIVHIYVILSENLFSLFTYIHFSILNLSY